MKTQMKGKTWLTNHFRHVIGCCKNWMLAAALVGAGQAGAATVTIYSNDFESYTNLATSVADESDADPDTAEWFMQDDTPLGNIAGSGVQAINWLANSGSKSLLVRPASEARVNLSNTKSGSRYQLDFRIYSNRGPTSSHNFYILLLGMGSDNNGGDFLAYRSDRVTNSTTIFCYDGVRTTPAFINVGTNHLTGQWQHHRIVFDPNVPSLSVYVDDMVTPLLVNSGTARSETPMPTLLRILNEGNTPDDGYFAIDDIVLTVDDSIDLATTFTEGFENYPARTDVADDADPKGPWITTETDGTAGGGGRPLAPGKVQVVDSTVVTPHFGSKSLKIEAGQRAGATIAWGQTPQTDVQITWWARVPASVQGTVGNYLRMSLYGAEGGNTYSGDSALLGYGSRDATIGDATSVTYFTTLWVDTTIDYTPDVWEEYQMTTHYSQGRYTVLKNPSSANPEVVVDRAAFIGPASSWGPAFMAAWSSSNGTNHPPVYIDDISIKSLVSSADPLPDPYTVTNHGSRFTNVTVLNVGGPVGKPAVDPRDNTTIIFAMDGAPGGIYRARKIAGGNWTVDPTPIVSGIDRPSGLALGADGTIWWTHDFTMSLQRLKTPWESSPVEEVVSFFADQAIDDDPIDVTIAPATFNGSLGQPNMVVVADRGSDGDQFNALNLIDPATTSLGQTNNNFLVSPTTSILGGGNLNAITSLPQYGEVVSLSQDGNISAVNGDGVVRTIIPAVLWQDIFSGGPAPAANALAVDPTTGRIWVQDDVRDEIWSIDATPGMESAAPDQKEVSFPLTNPNRTDLQLDAHDPGMAFATNGAFMVLSDTSVANGGGRLLIFHNESFSVPTFAITSASRVTQGFQLIWESAGSVKYRVQRGTNVASLEDITGDLTVTQFTDTNANANAFYRVVAKP